jgi:hypothetical protein
MDYTAFVDDDGSNTIGTVLSKAVLRDTFIGAEFTTTTTTGNIDDLDFANATLIRMNNASLATIRGLKAGVAGQRVTIVSVGAGQVDLAHQNTSDATAANRLVNLATSASTSLAAGRGTATYQYDATTARWRLVVHEQGAMIAVPYASGNFTASTGSWTVASGDQILFSYSLKGRLLTVILYLDATTVSATPTQLKVAMPGGYTTSHDVQSVGPVAFNNSSSVTTAAFFVSGPSTSATLIALQLIGSGVWAAATDNTFVRLIAQLPVD